MLHLRMHKGLLYIILKIMKTVLLTTRSFIRNISVMITVALLFSGIQTLAQSTTIYNSNGTFIVPEGVTQITVETWGGGGKGGTRTSNGGGGGGGGGAYARKVLSVTPGTTYVVSVGLGGTASQSPTDSWFGVDGSTILVLAKAGQSVANNTTSGGSGGNQNDCIGDVVLSGGNGANGASGYGGGGGSSAGNSAGGDDGSTSDGGDAPTGGGDGGNGRTGSQGNGSAGDAPGGGGGGARRTSSGTRNGGNGANGRVVVSWVPAFQATFISMNTGSEYWCPGETRTVEVTVQNTGQAAWTTADPHVRIGAKWNADADYYYRTEANNLLPGETRTYSISITAPNTVITENITFDVVNELKCWFANNNGVCGPGNTVYTSSDIYIGPPVADPITGSNEMCTNNSFQLTPNATGHSPFTYTFTSSNPSVASVDNDGNVTSYNNTGTTEITYTATSPTGCTSQPSAVFELTVNAAPTGTLSVTENSGVAPNDGIICAGDNIIFNATTGFSAYVFKVNGVTRQSSASRIYSTTNIADGDVVTVDAINGVNCLVTLNSVVVTVTPQPSATLSATENSGVAADDMEICAGDEVVFTATAGFNAYAFRVNGNIVQFGASNTFATTSLNNGDEVKVTVTNAQSCTFTTAPIVVSVHALPLTTLTVTENSGVQNNNEVCAGDAITFTAPSGYSNYNFKVNGTSEQNGASNEFATTALPALAMVTVEITNVNGCVSVSSPEVITTHEIPTGTLSFLENSVTPNDGTICAGSVVLFTATFGYDTYTFKVNGNTEQSGSSNVFNTSDLNHLDEVSVEVTGAGGCVAVFTPVVIQVNTVAPVSMTVTENSGSQANDLSICLGDEILFSATAGYSNYEFVLNGSAAQNGSSNEYLVSTLTDGDEVSVIATDANGCTTESDIEIIEVSEVPSPVLALTETSGISEDDGIICEGASVTFTITPTATLHNFYVNGVLQQSGVNNTFSTTTLQDGDKVVGEAVNGAGCSAITDMLEIEVLPLPVATLQVTETSGTANDGIICPLSSVIITATAGFSNYVFYVNNIEVQNGTSNVYNDNTFTTDTDVTVEVTNSNNCSQISSAITVTVLPLPTGVLSVTENSGHTNNDGKICTGANVTFTATSGYAQYNFKINGVSVQNSASNTYSSSTFADGDAVTVEVTHTNGCDAAFNTVVVEVSDYPVVPAITGSSSVCLFETVTLSNALTGGSWSSADNSIASVNAVTGEVTGINAGVTDIYYTYINAAGCAATVSVSFTVNGLPSPTLDGPNPFCPATISVYTTESGQSNYVWTVTGGTVLSGGTSLDNNITIDWNLPGVKSIFVNYTDANGCSGATSATVTGTSTITPVITGTPEVCAGITSVVYSTQAAQTDYTWIVGAGGTITSGGTTNDPTVTVTWNTAGAYNVSVNFTDVNGCSSPTETVYPVTVHPNPTATINGTTSVCRNATEPSVVFTGSNGTAPYTFTYRINGGAIQTVTTVSGNSVSVTVPTNAVDVFTYSLESVEDSKGCTRVVSGNAVVTVNELPTAAINGSTDVCRNATSPQVTFTGSGGAAPYIFIYNINGGSNQMITSVGNTAVINVPTGTAGVFNYNLVSVTDDNGCGQAQTGSAEVIVYELPSATIDGTASVCINGTAPVITLTGIGGNIPYTFYYNINGGTTQSITAVGSTATITPPVNAAGVFTYTLESVSNGYGPACNTSVSGSVVITVDDNSVGGTLSGGTDVCISSNSGTLTLSGHTGNVQRWESSTDGGINWTNISNTTTTLNYAGLTQTTRYRVLVANGVCTAVYSSEAEISVSQMPVGGSVSGATTVCSDVNSGTLTLSGNSGNIIRWQYSTDGGNIWNNINNTTSTLNYSNLTQTTWYKAEVGNGVCADVFSASAAISVNSRPTGHLYEHYQICNGSTANIQIQVTGTGTISGMLNGSIPFSGTAPLISVSVNPSINTTYTITSLSDVNCAALASNMTGSSDVTLNAVPGAITVTPSLTNICTGEIQSLTTSGAPITQSQVFNTGNVNVTMPDAFWFFVTIPGDGNHALNVSGIPAGAVVTGVDVRLNVDHNNIGDMIFNLQAPNGNILNLINRRGGSGDDLVNTVISSAGGTSFGSASAPFTGTFAPDAGNGITGGGGTSNVTSFTNLYSTPNGNWRLRFRDASSGTAGTLINWSITISYIVPATTPSVWSPATDLYTDAAATIPYDGVSALTTVYAKPSTSGNKIYTATFTNANNCSVQAQTEINAAELPEVQIIADYCSDPGFVRLTANATPAGAYNWSTGETTPFILVDIAASYSVTVTTGNGCVNTASMSIAEELIVNGDFEAGNIGFSSTYQYVNSTIQNGMYPEGRYTVNDNPTFNHANFWGRDHTSGSGKFMIVNGAGSPVNIWEQTVTVQPNTTYYFSAWAMSLNTVPPYAQLQFNVNGTNVGTTAVLGPRAHNNNPPYDWVRFYGTWTSGPSTTTAVVSIRDLQVALGGNDFGLDDISFGTLSTFVRIVSNPGTDDQTVCVNEPIENIAYSIGSGSAGPVVTGLPAGVTSSFNGERVTISGTPTEPGVYSYTITTTGGCNPTSITGLITVQNQTLTLVSGNNNVSVCTGSALTPIVYSIGGTATNANVTGLPSGLYGTLNGTDYTIEGTVSAAPGSYTYTLTTSGTCEPVSVTGTILVQAQGITLTSGVATQTKCVNTPITNIVLTLSGTATGASVTGLPAGVNGNLSGGYFIISGTPTVAGSYPFEVTTSGTCDVQTFNGTINVNPAGTINMSVASGSNVQTVCRQTPIDAIIYETGGGATGAYVTGLPTGVTGVFSGGTFTISGLPNTNGTFNYTVYTTGTCTQATATGTITVQSATISLASGSTNQSRCFGVAITNIVYNFGGVATGVDVTGLPSGVTGVVSGSQFIISGTPTASGTFSYSVTASGSCASTILTGSITVQPESIGGSISSVAVCSGENGTFTLTGHQGTILGWERSINNGASWTNISNNTPNLTFTNLTTDTWYRVRVRYGSCNIVYSDTAIAAVRNVWRGIVSNDWFDPANWSGNVLPSASCSEVTIPEVNAPAVYPVVNNNDITVNTLRILSGASLTVTDGTVYLTGSIINNGTFDITEGTLSLSGNTAQSIVAGTFYQNTVQHLIINNSSAAGVTLNGAVQVSGSLNFTPQGLILNTNDNLTLKSTAQNTAWVGNLTGKTINGKVTVERYIHTGTVANMHGKGWQLLAVPTRGNQTIKASWQEGATAIGHNPVPGYGTMITGNLANAVAEGFDVRTISGATIKTYNAQTGVWENVTSTINETIENPNGYMLFVRGDRSVTTSNAPATPTILRTTGELYMPGTNAPQPVTVPAGKFQAVGNPYASAIDLTSAGVQFNNLADVYYVWDPQLTATGSAYGLGGYQTFTRDLDGNYRVTPGGGSYGAPGSVKNTIESGQAFMVMSAQPDGGTDGSVSFYEDAKIPGSNLVSRQTPERTKSLRTNMYVLTNNTEVLLDGNAVQFNDNWSNDVDVQDALKFNNTGENFGLMRDGALLAVERRSEIRVSDTIHFQMSQLRVQAYKLEFLPISMDGDGTTAYLIDRHLGTTTVVPMNEMSYYSFSVSASEQGSYAPDRFILVFSKPLAQVPFTFTSVDATRNRDYTVDVRFAVDNEQEIEQYEIERSANGSSFTGVLTTNPVAMNGGVAQYRLTDLGALKSDNYYRIKAISSNGRVRYSSVVKVDAVTSNGTIAVYPNPVINNNIQVRFAGMEQGTYNVSLITTDGKTLFTKSVQLQTANETHSIQPGMHVAAGKYILVIRDQQNRKTIIHLLMR